MESELREKLDKIEARLGDLIVLESINIMTALPTRTGILTGKEKAGFLSKFCALASATLFSYSEEFDKRHGILIKGLEEMIDTMIKQA